MSISEYFNNVQELIKYDLENQEDINKIIDYVNRDNIQALINQYFNDNKSIDDCKEMILKLYNKNNDIDENSPNVLSGDRGENAMENILTYKEFKRIR